MSDPTPSDLEPSLAVVAQRDAYRARLAEVERERDEIRAQHAEAWTSISNLRTALDAAKRERYEAQVRAGQRAVTFLLTERRLAEALDVVRWLAGDRAGRNWSEAQAVDRARALLGDDRGETP